MSSDQDYMDFLNKANQDTGASTASTQSKSKTVGTKAVDTEVPKALQEVEEYYVSESDEPFEPVSLKWEKDSLPSENEFQELVGAKQEITSVNEKAFDPKGQYKTVFGAVKEAGSGTIAIFRTELDRSRVEYFVVSVDKKHDRLIGLKAIAVET